MTRSGLTPTGLRLLVAATVLSAAHHVDHLIRGVTGWPLTGGVNPFTYSLLVYPAIAIGLLLTARGHVGARFWSAFAGAGAVFVIAVHLGPQAGDAVQEIPGQYGSPLAAALALTLLVAFVAVLVITSAYEGRRPARQRTGGRA